MTFLKQHGLFMLVRKVNWGGSPIHVISKLERELT